MTQIAQYYELLFNIEMSDNKLVWLEKETKFKDELAAEHQTNQSLKKELNDLKTLLLMVDNDADKIRVGYIHNTNSILSALSKIESWDSYYPDLSQGMVIPGYLLGQMLNDYKTNLTTEGNYYPVA